VLGRAAYVLVITQVPAGEAPLWVREKWLDLTLPLANPMAGKSLTGGVLTGPRTRWDRLKALLFGGLSVRRGWAVPVEPAIEVLHRSSPEAAQWWRENAPHLFTGHRRFLFRLEEGELRRL